MKHILLGLSLIISLMSFSPAGAQDIPAFPGAEGVARWTTTGGRGGKVIHVTNLNDSGTGSLRAACTASGARIVVFDVSGIIELKSMLKINNPNITIEGQTAPGDGICLKNYTFNISASNVIIRFIRCRMGDEAKAEDDAMNAYFKTGDEKSNIIIDHCTMSWSTDECGSFYGIKNFTLQWCMLSESLRISVHDKGQHGYGGIWGGQNTAYHHNMIAHHDSRNPRFDHDYVNTLKGPIDYINNVVYNWGGNSTYGGESANNDNNYKKYNMINNYYKPGSATKSSVKSRIVNPTTKCSNCTNKMGTSIVVPGHFYITGNYMYGSPSVTNDNWQGVYPDDASKKDEIKSDTRFVPTGYEGQTLVTTHTAEQAFDKVLAYAGASYKKDVIDQRIAKEVQDGSYTFLGSKGSTGGLIDTQADVGGWPTYISKTKLTDTDGDGMPDIWEQAVGGKDLDPTGYDLDPKHYYTNLEVYANALVEDLVRAQNADAETAIDEYYPAVAKVDGIPYYDADVTAEGGYGSDDPVDGSSGIISWLFDKGTAGQEASVQAGISTGIASTSVTLGSELSYDGTQNISGLGTETKIKQNNVNASEGTDDNAITFSLTTASGYRFKGTEVSFTATRLGTDRGKMNIKWVDGKGTAALANGVTPNRNNATPPYSTYTYDITGKSEATDGTCSLVINLYELSFHNDSGDNFKDVGYAFINITGTLVSPTGISTPVVIKGDGTIYNLKGQKVNENYKGIVIKDGKKVVIK